MGVDIHVNNILRNHTVLFGVDTTLRFYEFLAHCNITLGSSDPKLLSPSWLFFFFNALTYADKSIRNVISIFFKRKGFEFFSFRLSGFS